MAEWTYAARVEHPSGIQVLVTVRVPTDAALDWPSKDCAELAQMGASQTMAHIIKIKEDFREEPPF